MRIRNCILLLAMSLAQALMAQTPYQGGSNDGHSMASFELGPVSPVYEHTLLAIYPNILRSGDMIHLPDKINVKEVYLVSVNGTAVLLHTGSLVKSVRVESLPPGMFILQMHTPAGRIFNAKLLLLKD